MSEHDPIETLLKATGRRPKVPAERMERVRDVAEAAWRHDVARRVRRRRVRWIATLSAAAVVLVAVGLGIRSFRSPFAGVDSGIRVERVANAASARHGTIPILRSELALQVGSIIPRNATVVTAAGARVALRAPFGHSIRLDSDTTLRVLSDAAFVLERGAIYVDSHGGTTVAASSLRIDTPVGAIEDRGTQFEARWEGGSLSLRVREGQVTIEAVAGPLIARAGEALRLDAAGRVDRSDQAASGQAWAWTETIAPMMDIQGRSLMEFLDWVVRERGARLQFADTRLAGRAPAILLRGSITGMTLDEATASVLATCGLTHRWEGGALLVGSEPEGPPPR
jgi:ferric-dicitrate binding protein FerR (iron transport regulator)